MLCDFKMDTEYSVRYLSFFHYETKVKWKKKFFAQIHMQSTDVKLDYDNEEDHDDDVDDDDNDNEDEKNYNGDSYNGVQMMWLCNALN